MFLLHTIFVNTVFVVNIVCAKAPSTCKQQKKSMCYVTTDRLTLLYDFNSHIWKLIRELFIIICMLIIVTTVVVVVVVAIVMRCYIVITWFLCVFCTLDFNFRFLF